MLKHVSILFLLCLSGFCVVSARAQTQADKPPRILSRPRPNYTDEARKDNVQGVVLVKVTFEANGTIGKVSGVSENAENLRKSGLVNSAIEAAKKIKFEPAMKNGKAVRATQIMQYRFTLY